MARTWRWPLAVALPLVLAACTSSRSEVVGGVTGSGPAAVAVLRTIRHGWVIDLENQGYAQTFGNPSADPNLARTLPRLGALLESYYAIGHSSAANQVAQVSGQAPDLGTHADCPLWTPFPGDVVAGPYHQVLGEGCVYPAPCRRWATSCRVPGWAALPCRTWATIRPGTTRSPRRGDPPAATPPGPSTAPSAPSGATSTPRRGRIRGRRSAPALGDSMIRSRGSCRG
jgi:hypothetical protein